MGLWEEYVSGFSENIFTGMVKYTIFAGFPKKGSTTMHLNIWYYNPGD